MPAPPQGTGPARAGGRDEPDLRKLFEVWVDSELKAQMVVFFNNNPGVIETAEGLARRLGLDLDALREAVSDHVRLGLLEERKLGDKTVLLLNRARRGAIQDTIVNELRRRLGAAA